MTAFKNPMLAGCFADVSKAARDNFSRLYVAPVLFKRGYERTHGPNYPHRGGSTLHHAFWNGFKSDRPATVRGSMAYAAWRAGQEFRRSLPPRQ